MTIAEVSSITRLSRATLYAYVCRKQIPHIKLGTRTMFSEHDIEQWIRARTIQPVHISAEDMV